MQKLKREQVMQPTVREPQREIFLEKSKGLMERQHHFQMITKGIRGQYPNLTLLPPSDMLGLPIGKTELEEARNQGSHLILGVPLEGQMEKSGSNK